MLNNFIILFTELVPEDNQEWQYLFGGETSEHSDEEYDEGHVDIQYYRNKVSWVVLDEINEDEELLSGKKDCMLWSSFTNLYHILS